MRYSSTYLTKEDIGGSIDTLTGSGANSHLQEPTQLEHHPLHHPVVVQDLDAETEEQDHRQHLKNIKYPLGGNTTLKFFLLYTKWQYLSVSAKILSFFSMIYLSSAGCP